MGSGPCLSLCAPILMSYAAAHKTTLKKSVLSYFIFSSFKLISYLLLGAIWMLGVQILRNIVLREYLDIVYLILGCFIILIGITTIVRKGGGISEICSWVHKGNIRNVGVLGILVGLSPCLPLLGILNYIVIISDRVLDALLFSFVFGLGTVFSPLFILMILSSKIGGLSSGNTKFNAVLRIICGGVLLFLGGRIILQILLR